MAFNLQRTARYFALRFKRLRGDPHALALGTAIGIFIGITPTLPLHTVAIIGVTFLFRASTIAAIISASIVSNPLTFALQYYLAWKIGSVLMPGRLTWERLQDVLHLLTDSGFMDGLRAVSHLSGDAIIVMLTGGLLMAIPLGVISYFVSLRFFHTLQKKRRHKHILH